MTCVVVGLFVLSPAFSPKREGGVISPSLSHLLPASSRQLTRHRVGSPLGQARRVEVRHFDAEAARFHADGAFDELAAARRRPRRPDVRYRRSAFSDFAYHDRDRMPRSAIFSFGFAMTITAAASMRVCIAASLPGFSLAHVSHTPLRDGEQSLLDDGRQRFWLHIGDRFAYISMSLFEIENSSVASPANLISRAF